VLAAAQRLARQRTCGGAGSQRNSDPSNKPGHTTHNNTTTQQHTTSRHGQTPSPLSPSASPEDDASSACYSPIYFASDEYQPGQESGAAGGFLASGRLTVVSTSAAALAAFAGDATLAMPLLRWRPALLLHEACAVAPTPLETLAAAAAAAGLDAAGMTDTSQRSGARARGGGGGGGGGGLLAELHARLTGGQVQRSSPRLGAMASGSSGLAMLGSAGNTGGGEGASWTARDGGRREEGGREGASWTARDARARARAGPDASDASVTATGSPFAMVSSFATPTVAGPTRSGVSRLGTSRLASPAAALGFGATRGEASSAAARTTLRLTCAEAEAVEPARAAGTPSDDRRAPACLSACVPELQGGGAEPSPHAARADGGARGPPTVTASEPLVKLRLPPASGDPAARASSHAARGGAAGLPPRPPGEASAGQEAVWPSLMQLPSVAKVRGIDITGGGGSGGGGGGDMVLLPEAELLLRGLRLRVGLDVGSLQVGL
jgi:hypothetical protein